MPNFIGDRVNQYFMSQEKASEFVKTIQTMNELMESISKANDNDQDTIISDAGYDFTFDELKQAFGELTDKDVEGVSGGGNGGNGGNGLGGFFWLSGKGGNGGAGGNGGNGGNGGCGGPI